MKVKEAATQQQKLAVQLHKIANLTHRIHKVDRRSEVAEKAEKVSVHRGQGRVLALLKDGSLSIAQLVEQLDIRPSSAGELVSKLEQQGFVTKETSEDDKRVALVSLTEKGSAILENTVKVNNSYFEDMFSGLNDEEQKQLSELLDKLITSLKEKGEEKGIALGDPTRSRKNKYGHGHHRGQGRGHRSHTASCVK